MMLENKMAALLMWWVERMAAAKWEKSEATRNEISVVMRTERISREISTE
jgi:hypothetical protein